MRVRAMTAGLIRQQLDAQLNQWRRLPVRPHLGWIRSIRKALGMPSKVMAERMKVSPATMTKLEQAERGGTISLRSLRDAAAALDCDLVYALVPKQSLETMLRNRATEVANEHVRRVSHTMHLEDQAVSNTEAKRQRDIIAEELIQSLDKGLWTTARRR